MWPLEGANGFVFRPTRYSNPVYSGKQESRPLLLWLPQVNDGARPRLLDAGVDTVTLGHLQKLVISGPCGPMELEESSNERPLA